MEDLSFEMYKALKQAEDVIGIVWVSNHANRCDAAVEEIQAVLKRYEDLNFKSNPSQT
jgi:hypothetical protein